MIKKILLAIAVILLIILIFVTDFGLYLLLAFILAFVTWLLTKTGKRKVGKVIVQVGILMVMLPLLIMFVVFMVKSYCDPAAAEELASSTIDAMVTYIGENLPFIFLSEFAGTVVGAFTGGISRAKSL